MSPPLTHEQLALASKETERAVSKAVRKYRRQATAGFLVLAAGLVFAVHTQGNDAEGGRKAIVQSGRAVAVDSCNGRYQDREGLRNLLLAAERQLPAEVKRGNISPAQLERAQSFYDTQLNKLRLPDCRRAARIITSDPEHTVKVPHALHPPDVTLPAAHDSIFSG